MGALENVKLKDPNTVARNNCKFKVDVGNSLVYQRGEAGRSGTKGVGAAYA